MLVWSMSVTTGSMSIVAVDRPELARGGLGLGQVLGDVVARRTDLPLKVVVSMKSRSTIRTCRRRRDQGVGQHGPEGADAAQRHPALEKLFLALFADAIKPHLPAVTFKIHDPMLPSPRARYSEP